MGPRSGPGRAQRALNAISCILSYSIISLTIHNIFLLPIFIVMCGSTEATPISETPKTLYIHNVCYDITDFVKFHPGGNVILSYEGQDATLVYEEMHRRSKKAFYVLRSLPTVQSFPSNSSSALNNPMIDDFRDWRISLEERGFFKPSRSHAVYRLLELAGIFGLATFFMSLASSSSWYTVIAILLFGLFGGRCGWVQHEAGHRSFTGDIYTDTLIQKATIGFGLLTSGPMWNHMHNRHHATTQKLGYDMDLETMPFVLFNSHAYSPQKLLSSTWLKYQAYSFLPITSGLFVMLFWIFYLHPRKIWRDQDWLQAGYTYLGGHMIRPCIISYVSGYDIITSYGLNLASLYVSGIYLFGHFSTSHTFMPVVDSNDHPNWIEYSLDHTVDIDTQNPIVCWLMGYLNCQCIHHLFPQMPQYRQPEVSRELAVFAKKWNLYYTELSYWDAWYKTFANLNKVGSQLDFVS